MKAPAHTTVTVTENGVMFYFRLVPLVSIMEFIDKVGELATRKDVDSGEARGFWKVVV